MKAIAWKIWYTDNRVFNSKDYKWEDLPDDGVLIWMIYHDEKDGQGRHYRTIVNGYDWHFCDNKGLYAYNNETLESNKRRYPDCSPKSFKRGIWVTNEEFNRVRNIAMEDYDI